MITVSRSGLITVTGGKWTTYRKMAEDIIDKAILVGSLKEIECVTKNMPIHGYVKNIDFNEPCYYYGADKEKFYDFLKTNKYLNEKIHPALTYLRAEVVWSVRNEMTRTVEDFLARRSRALFLDARTSIEAAPITAKLIAKELGYGRKWIKKQVEDFTDLAKGYYLR